MLKTVQITAHAVFPNTTPFSGYIRVGMHPNFLDVDVEGEVRTFVAEVLNQKFPFNRNREARFRLIPNSILGENTYYTIEIWKAEKTGLGTKDFLMYKSNVIVPDEDCNLADLVITEPMVIEPIEASKLYATEAKATVGAAREILNRAEMTLNRAKSFFVWDVAKGKELHVYAAPLVSFEISADMKPSEVLPANGVKSPENPSVVSANPFFSVSVSEVSGKTETHTCFFDTPIWGGYLDLSSSTVEASWEGYEFTGEENFERVLVNGKYGFMYTFIEPSISGGSDDVLVCSHFVPAPHDAGTCYVTNNGYSLVMVPTDQTKTTVGDFKAWLIAEKEAGTPCIVARKFDHILDTISIAGFDVLSLSQDDYFTPKLNIVTSNIPITLGYPMSPTYVHQTMYAAILSLGGKV